MVFVLPVGMPIVEEYLPRYAGKVNGPCSNAKQRLVSRDVEFIAEYSGTSLFGTKATMPEDVERSLTGLQVFATKRWSTN